MRLFTRLLLLSFALVWCESSAGRSRAVAGRIDSFRNIVLVTAHPDDEILVAPLLENRCVRGGATCTIVVLTRGEAGGDPEIRTAEMARSAALLNLRLLQWSYPDVLADVATAWGDRVALLTLLGDVTRGADAVFTFDPAHGSTGHPAHRELGQLVLESGAPNVFLIETRVDGLALSNADPRSWSHSGDWNAFVRVAETHASQFTAAQVDVLRANPARVWFRPAL